MQSSDHLDKKDSNENNMESSENRITTQQLPLQIVRQRSLFTSNQSPKVKFNVAAPPFVLNQQSMASKISENNHTNYQNILSQQPSFTQIGNLKINNSHIWSSISSNRLPIYAPENICRSSNLQSNFPQYNTRDYNTAKPFGPIALPNGIIQLNLRDTIRIDMTLDKSVCVINSRGNVMIALSNTGNTSALSHPNGTVFQHGARVDIIAHDGMKKNNFVRYAKMWHKGISLTSEGCALIYLVDSAGTRTTSDTIMFDKSADYINPVFYNGSRHGADYAEEAFNLVQSANFWLNEDGTEIFEINSFRISQTVDGLVRVTRANNKCTIRTSPSNGSATITTPYIHCTASLGQTSHLFVRRDERRMHFDGSAFVVRNAGHSAGFDETNRLRVY